MDELTAADYEQLRLDCAARVAALVDALRSIPSHLAPCTRSRMVAVREQIYFGWERPLADARGSKYVFGKYERDGWWSSAAADLVVSGGARRGDRQLEREHVHPVSDVVNHLLSATWSAAEVADLLESQLLTCTVLADEHRRLRRGEGWQRYADAGISVRHGLDDLTGELSAR